MQMEDFRDGGEGVAYHDLDAANKGGEYRLTEGVDIQPCALGGYNLCYGEPTEWLEYSINVPVSGLYSFEFSVASPANDIKFYVDYASGSSSTVTVPNTGGWQTWQPGGVNLNLLAGIQNIRFNIVAGGNFDKAVIKRVIGLSHDATLSNISVGGVNVADFSPSVISYQASAPYFYPPIVATQTDATATYQTTFSNNVATIVVTAGDGTTKMTYTVTLLPINLSSTIDQSVTLNMENFNSVEGVGYHDTDPLNKGNALFRMDEGVDIEISADGGRNISYGEAGEWLEYSINVPLAGTYNFTFYVAGLSDDVKFYLNYAGGVSETVTVPNPAGWQNWQPGSIKLNLQAGLQTIRFNIVAGGNFDKAIISLSSTASGAPTNIVATAGNTKASIAFTAPASNGGSAILDYTVTSSPGSLIATGTSSPITVSGLNNGTAYTFTVTARNAAGASAGAASSAVTPHATNNNIAVSAATNISALTLTPISDLVVSSNKLTINSSATVNSITVAPGAELELTSSNTLTAGTVTLQSDATGTATFVDNTTNAPQAVTATVQQYVEAGRNWYMSIPLASGASSLLSRGTSVVCYDEPSGTWIAPVSNTLDKLRGYVQVATSTPSVTGTTGTVDFTGVVNTGMHSISLSRTAGKTGFNLVGNPYPSYLDWNAVTKTNVSNTLWYRTKEGGVYKFYTFIANGVGSPATVTNKIPPMQAFWVRVNTEGTGSIAVDNTMRSHKDVAGNIMKAPKQNTQQVLRLQVSNGTNSDETVVYFNANASDAFDQYDAQKRTNGEPSVPEIFTQVGSEQLVINGMNQVKYNTEIPIGFSTEQANDFSISANEMSNFEAGTKVILIDKLNPTVENELNNGTAYNFSAPVTAATTNRFSLILRAPGVATAIDNATKLNAQVFVNTNNQITIIAPEKATYSIYNTVGILLENGVLNYKLHTINCKLNSGVYFVALSINGQREIQKVIIK